MKLLSLSLLFCLSMAMFSCSSKGGENKTPNTDTTKTQNPTPTPADNVNEAANANLRAKMLVGKWKLEDGNTSYEFTEKTYKAFNGDKEEASGEYALYDKCMDQGGQQNPEGNFIGMQGDNKVCFEITYIDETELTVVAVGESKGGEMTFEKVN